MTRFMFCVVLQRRKLELIMDKTVKQFGRHENDHTSLEVTSKCMCYAVCKEIDTLNGNGTFQLPDGM